MPIGNGGIIGPNNTPSTSSAKGVWSIREAMLAQRAGNWPLTVYPDPYFEYTTLLLPGNGTNGAQNNTFLDSSTNNFTITRGGNTTQGTFSPFSQTGWSWYFDGTGDTLSWSGTTLSGDFTVECWVYKTAVDGSGYTNVFSSASQNNQLYFDNTTAGSIGLVIGASSIIAPSGTSVTSNFWHHLAWVREGSTCRAYVNGVQQGTGTSSASFNLSLISQFQTGGYEMNGYISNARIVSGTCLYPSGTPFTPPTTPLTAISGTQLLVCQSNRFIDNSTNAFAITRNGDVSVQAFSPFNPTAVWSASTNGGSAYFDGSGDYLSAGTSSAFTFGTGNFTVEGWLYVTAVASYQVMFSSRGPAMTGVFCGLETGTTQPVVYNSGAKICQSSVSLPLNTWNHVAYVRNSGTTSIYINGVSVASGADSTNYTGTYGVISYDVQDNNWLFYGYMSSVRIVNGTAVYTSNFTPPTAPVTAITNTSLLCNFTNAGIYDATSKNDLETVGNAQISTAQSKFGGSSISLDGTGDYVVEPTNLNYGYGTGDFTIEFWLYLNSTALQTIFSNLSSASSTNPHLYLNTTIRYFTASADRITGTSLSTGQWYHIALCRASGSTRLFVDGTQSGSTYADANNYGVSAPFGVGTYWASGAPVSSNTLNGYINDLRITKGFARYTANFTPPTAAFPLL